MRSEWRRSAASGQPHATWHQRQPPAVAAAAAAAAQGTSTVHHSALRAAAPSSDVALGTRQLFLDLAGVAAHNGCTRQMHTPTRHGNVVLPAQGEDSVQIRASALPLRSFQQSSCTSSGCTKSEASGWRCPQTGSTGSDRLSRPDSTLGRRRTIWSWARAVNRCCTIPTTLTRLGATRASGCWAAPSGCSARRRSGGGCHSTNTSTASRPGALNSQRYTPIHSGRSGDIA